MLPWQHNVRKKGAVWGKFILAAVTLHLLFLGVLLFVTDGDQHMLHVSMNNTIDWANAKIVVLPFHRVAPASLRGGGASGTGTSGQKAARTTSQPLKTETVEKKKKQTKKPSTMLRTDAKKKNEAAAQRAKKKERETALAAQKKKSADKKAATLKKQKLAETQKKNKKKLVEKKVSQPIAPPSAPELLKTAAAVPAVADATEPSAAGPLAITAARDGQGGNGAGDGTIYVGQAELDSLRVQQEIQQEIETHWSPPAGLADVSSCQIKALIDWQGAAHDVQMVKASGVLLYDVSARAAVQAICFPQGARGKELVITFS